jgi:diguanylate cyclase (GGDEF)-like protein
LHALSWLRLLAQIALPAAVLAAAYLLVVHHTSLPPSLAASRIYAPYLVLAVAVALSLAFNRGRALLALVVFAVALAARAWFLSAGIAQFAPRVVFIALCIVVPLVLAVLALLRERGALGASIIPRLALVIALPAIGALIIATGDRTFIDQAYAPILANAAVPATPIPQLGLAALIAGFIVATALAIVRNAPIERGFAGAIVAYGLALHFVKTPEPFALFMAAGELLIAIAVLEDTFRMAFRDELTGLASRRALNEQLHALGRRYVVAMLDVDHFKQFNDTYGHEVGDQVLKMVATQIARVGGGGKSYRYGGEEFTVLFPGKSIEGALPHLEAVRCSVADYALALRAPGRPQRMNGRKRRQPDARPGKTVSVTISIGVAGRTERTPKPMDVVNAADRALYRAKHKGRNQVSV